jgi:hypothetical protein
MAMKARWNTLYQDIEHNKHAHFLVSEDKKDAEMYVSIRKPLLPSKISHTASTLIGVDITFTVPLHHGKMT